MLPGGFFDGNLGKVTFLAEKDLGKVTFWAERILEKLQNGKKVYNFGLEYYGQIE